MSSLRTKNNETWMLLLKATKPTAMQHLQNNAAHFFGVHNEETQKVAIVP